MAWHGLCYQADLTGVFSAFIPEPKRNIRTHLLSTKQKLNSPTAGLVISMKEGSLPDPWQDARACVLGIYRDRSHSLVLSPPACLTPKYRWALDEFSTLTLHFKVSARRICLVLVLVHTDLALGSLRRQRTPRVGTPPSPVRVSTHPPRTLSSPSYRPSPVEGLLDSFESGPLEDYNLDYNLYSSLPSSSVSMEELNLGEDEFGIPLQYD